MMRNFWQKLVDCKKEGWKSLPTIYRLLVADLAKKSSIPYFSSILQPHKGRLHPFAIGIHPINRVYHAFSQQFHPRHDPVR